jgi:hypothetical protein
VSNDVASDRVWLARGSHPDSGDGCLMEWVAVLAGLEKTDHPACTNELIATVAIYLNDGLGDVDRQRLVTLIPELQRARRTRDDRLVDTRLAIWCAASMAHLVPGPYGPVHRRAVDAAAGCLAGTVDPGRCRDAAVASAEVGARALAPALYAAADAAHAAACDGIGARGAIAFAARWALVEGDAVDWFRGLLAAHAAAVVEEEPVCSAV